MLPRRVVPLLQLGLLLLLSPVALAADQHCGDASRACEALQPSRHMSLKQIRPGMVGYGITALPGNPVTEFSVQIVDVLYDFAGPQRHVILAQCSGAGLETTGILAGMSGSPVYMPDPDDNDKPKMIGAVAYGWSFNKEPLCGIQPIEQMLAAKTTVAPTTSVQQVSLFSTGGANSDTLRKLASGWRGSAAGLDPLFDTTNASATTLAASTPSAEPKSVQANNLQPLGLPLGITGAGEAVMGSMQALLAGSGLAPVATTTASHRPEEINPQAKALKPGDPVAVLLAWGDMDMSAVGTVTEVIGSSVYAFGHSFNADGPVSLPLAAAEIKGRVASMERPFKIAAAGDILGTFQGDQQTALVGELGIKPPSIPVEVNVVRPECTQTYHYYVAQHPFLTPLMTAATIEASLVAQKKLPDRNTMRYEVDMDFGEPGKYRTENLVSATAGMATMSALVGDVAAPVAGMTAGPRGPVYPKAIKAQITLMSDMRLARVLDAKLLTPGVHPGDTAQIGVRFQNADGKIFTRSYEMEIPASAAPGKYRISAASWQQHLLRLKAEQPDRFDPHDLQEMLGLLNLVGATRQDQLYLRLVPQDNSGISVAGHGLPSLPSCWGKVLADSAGSAARPEYIEATVKQIPLEFALSGSAEFDLSVEKLATTAMFVP